MRLLYVCSDFGVVPSGTKGAAIHLRAITRSLAELGHEVILLSPKEGPGDGHPAHRLLPAGCPKVRETSRLLKHWLNRRGYGDAVARELRPLLYNAWVHERAIEAAAAARPDAIIERLSLFGHVGLDLAHELDIPLVLEVNAILTEESKAFRGLQLERLAEAIERNVLTAAAAIVVVSGALADRLADLGIAREKIHVAANGVDPAMFDQVPRRDLCRRRLGIGQAFVVGFAGSLKAWHGVDVLLEAFGRLHRDDPTARLLIVGTGPMETALRETAERLRLEDAVIFTGAVSHDRVPALLGAMDVAVAPFRSVENFYFSPIKLFEYMASGVCVVASRLGQIREVIKDGENGLLCSPDDAGALHAALARAAGSAEMRERLAAVALEMVRRHHTWRHAAEKTLHAIEFACRRRGENASGPHGEDPVGHQTTEVLS